MHKKDRALIYHQRVFGAFYFEIITFTGIAMENKLYKYLLEIGYKITNNISVPTLIQYCRALSSFPESIDNWHSNKKYIYSSFIKNSRIKELKKIPYPYDD